VSVRVTDANGPRGGADQVCNVKVVLSGLPSVIIERQDTALRVAIDIALRAMEHAVQRSVRRRRMKPLRDKTSRQSAAGTAGADGKAMGGASLW
jgi:hypothetical protein